MRDVVLERLAYGLVVEPDIGQRVRVRTVLALGLLLQVPPDHVVVPGGPGKTEPFVRVAKALDRIPHQVDEVQIDDLIVGDGLTDVADIRVDSLPTGQGRLIELGRALATNPRVLLLDEPAAGQDDSETDRFAALLRELAAEGMAVLLVEHDVALVMEVCEQIHVLDFGEIIAFGPPDEIRVNDAVLAAYLGTQAEPTA